MDTDGYAVRLRSVADGALTRIAVLQNQDHEPIEDAIISKDGRFIAAGSLIVDSSSFAACLWREDGILVWKLRELADVEAIAFSPDGATLAIAAAVCELDQDGHGSTCGAGGWLRLYRATDMSLLHELKVVSLSDYESLAFSPDGASLAAGRRSSDIEFWDVSSGLITRTVQSPVAYGGVSSLAFNPDGMTLASGSFNGSVLLWRVSNGQILFTLAGHKAAVNIVVFSPDGAELASGSGEEGVIHLNEEPNERQDKSIQLWRVSDGSLIRSVTGLSRKVVQLVFVADGQALLSGSSDGTRLWHIP